jgi:hypothetical protein
MPVSSNHIVTVVALALAGLALCGCASINEKVTNGVVDNIPRWAGGLPPDVPPRRGTPEYDAYMQERERKRLEPAVAADGAKPSSPLSPVSASSSASNASALALDPVH